MSARRLARLPGMVLPALALLVAGGSWAGASLTRQDAAAARQPFPHARHAGLFPTCLGCHAGIETGDTARWLTVGPEECANCHNGQVQKKVSWTPPRRPLTNLDFGHATHAAALASAGERPADCLACHRQEGATKRMEVVMARPELCVSCHAHRAPEHLALEARCSTCHEPLASASRLTAADIADFPEPAWHHSSDFLLRHGRLATAAGADCSVCHARESCTRCHLNAGRVAAIQSLPPDPRVARLVQGRAGSWPEPASHRSASWIYTHGGPARTSLGTCANCHAASSCVTCHTGRQAGLVARLPGAVRGGPTGVLIHASPPGHGPGFTTAHGVMAAAGALDCASCHTAEQCTACHRGGVPSTPALGAPGTGTSSGGPTSLVPRTRGSRGTTGTRPESPVAVFASAGPSGRPPDGRRRGREDAGRSVVMFASLRSAGPDTTPGPSADTASARKRAAPRSAGAASPPRTGGFHPPDYLLHHGADAFGRQTECTECHSTQAFCLACHQKMGLGAGGGLGTSAYHDAQPNWLLVHGRAARQNIESCVACHQESSCLRCHSAKFGFRIDPHGPGFDPNRIANRSTISCGICHLSLPTGQGGG